MSKVLDLSRNSIDRIGSYSFKGLTKVAMVDLEYNKIKKDAFLIDLIRECGQVKEINCASNELLDISDNLKDFLADTEDRSLTINLEGNRVDEPINNVFQYHNDDRLEAQYGLYELITSPGGESTELKEHLLSRDY